MGAPFIQIYSPATVVTCNIMNQVEAYSCPGCTPKVYMPLPNVVVRDYRGRIIGAGDLTARYSKRQGGFTLCICNRYAIRRNLGYLSHERLKIIRGLQLRNLTEAIKLIEKWYNVRITLFRLWT
ncbi:MAG: hypothetical protein QXL85_06965 [Candidatus Bathyarchaeia archaeon]